MVRNPRDSFLPTISDAVPDCRGELKTCRIKFNCRASSRTDRLRSSCIVLLQYLHITINHVFHPDNASGIWILGSKPFGNVKHNLCWDSFQQRYTTKQHRMRNRFRPSGFHDGHERQFVQRTISFQLTHFTPSLLNQNLFLANLGLCTQYTRRVRLK